MPFRLGYRPALDGVRGVAILGVMAFHAGLPLPGGSLGVDLFFVLSGFLITGLLLEEWEERGTIRLGAFYVRRALRLFPALAVLLAALALFSLRFPVYQAVEARREIAYTFFYVANWALAFGRMPAMSPLGHAWSLAIEEQFYLAWPLVLLALLRRGITRRGLAALAAGATLAAAALRLALWQQGATVDRLFYGFDTRCDALLAGCLAGIVAGWPGRAASPAAAAALSRAAAVAAPLLVAVTWIGGRHQDALFAGGFTVLAVSAAVLILHVVDRPDSPLARALATRPLAGVGRISYGLYLWHWPVFLTVVTLMQPRGWSDGAMVAARFAAALAIAGLSSRLVEKPALRWKARWS